MNKHNTYTTFLIFSLISILSERSSAPHYQYEACEPVSCDTGPNISFPFHIKGVQESYCGYPGFEVTCKDTTPVLSLSENEYVVEDIFYQNRSLRVFDAVLLGSNGSGCLPRMRNLTLPQPQFSYANETVLHLFSNCKNLSEGFSKYFHGGCGGDGNNGGFALYDGDENVGVAMEDCEENVVVPVDGFGSVVSEVLRRGFVMKWRESDCSVCQESGGFCGFNETSFHFRCFCPDNRPHLSSCKPEKSRALVRKYVLLGILTAAALASTSIILIFFFKRKNKLLHKADSRNVKDIELFLKNYGNLAPLRYKYSDIKKMTNSFRENLGKGGYGTVFKGKLPDGHPVAVKVLDESKGNGEEFMNEVASISRTSHVNIVTLLGFCFEGDKRALIYEFMPNGSLEKFIHNSSADEGVLGWQKLFEIALGIARGLEYLHQGCNTRILHFDIKPHNILLDKDFNPRISDFGLAKLCPNRSSIVSMLVARGTIGYIAPEVFCRNFGEVSHKSDVYSYGMMVLEIGTGGRKNINRADVDRTTETYFPQYIYKQLEMDQYGPINDHIMMNEDESWNAKRKLMIVGLWCIQTDPKDRPSMSKVVEMLEGKLESLQLPPKPNLSSPTTSAPATFSTSEST